MPVLPRDGARTPADLDALLHDGLRGELVGQVGPVGPSVRARGRASGRAPEDFEVDGVPTAVHPGPVRGALADLPA